jgi:hypothetical protein
MEEEEEEEGEEKAGEKEEGEEEVKFLNWAWLYMPLVPEVGR